MDLLFAAETLVPAVGGAERTMLEWSRGLRARGHHIRTVYLPAVARADPDRYWRWRAERRTAVGKLVASAISSRRPDLVVAQLHAAPAALGEADLLGVPGVLVLPSYEAICKLAFVPGSDCPSDCDCARCPTAGRLAAPERVALLDGRRSHARALANAVLLVVPSHAVAATVRRHGGRDAEVIWPVGPAMPASAGASHLGPVVCAAANWGPHKGAAMLPALVAACRRAPPARSRPVRVTEPGLTASQRAAVRAAGGTLVTSPVAELFAGASLVLVPSQWEEPFGRIAWEALARGIPVLASDAGGLAGFVPSELRVAPRDDQATWSNAIGRLLGDRRAWTAAAARARPAAARLLEPPPLDRLEELLGLAAERTGGRRAIAGK